MFGFRKKLLLPLLLIYLAAAGPAAGRIDDFQLKRHLIQATTHPDIDLSPRVSPDGKWMVYVNRNAGNFDIWLQSTGGGRAIPITKHKADDFYPVWGPNSRWIVFVSQRSDAAGDIWRINLRPVKKFLIPKGKPKQITFYQGMDTYPTVSPDGKKIAWASDRSGREEIWFFNYNTDKIAQLTFLGGTQPCWSSNQELIAFTSFRAGPDCNGDIWLINLHGRKPELPEETKLWDPRELPSWQITTGPALDGFPAWSEDARSIVFERHDFDSDGDGRITPDDHGMLWSVTVREEPDYTSKIAPVLQHLTGASFVPAMIERVMPLSSGAEYIAQPSFGGNGRLYFVADRQGNLDAWSTAQSGYIPKFSTADSQYAFAEEHFPLPERMRMEETGPLLFDFDSATLSYNDRLYLGDRIIALHRVFDLFQKQSSLTANALYDIGFAYGLLGYAHKAAAYFQLVQDHFPDDSLQCAYAGMGLLGLRTREQFQAANLTPVTDGLQKIAEKYRGVKRAFIAASIYLADLLARSGEFARAGETYLGIIRDFPEYEEAAAECLFKLGKIHEKTEPDKALDYYIKLFKEHGSQRRWVMRARDRILNRELSQKSLDEQRQVCQLLTERYSAFPQIAVAAQLRLAAVLEELDDLEGAYKIFSEVENRHGNMPADVFKARLGKADNLLKRGLEQEAFAYYEELLAIYHSKNKEYYQGTLEGYLSTLLQSADALKGQGRYAQAKNRYKQAIALAPGQVRAHKGYVECFYRLGEIDAAIAEYESKNPYKLRDNVLIYALGLAYSYKGTEKAERTGNPEYIDVDLLHNSSRIVAIALTYDYSFVEAYLTIAFNYELTENYYDHQRAKPVPYYRRAFNMLIAPVQSLYRTLTFYNETKTPRYYERAIHELTKAITLNDERTNPGLEAALALNLANNYYSLGEFGFARAYENYRTKLLYDSTFTSTWQKAKFFERLGHCSLYVEATDEGIGYLEQAIALYSRLGQNDKVIINTKRLALLEEIAGEHDAAVAAYQRAATLEEESERLTGLMRSYRSIAFNHLQAGRPRQAITFAQKSLELVESGRIPVIKDEPHRVKFGFLGWYLPIPFVNLAALGASSGTVLTTDQERAFAYTILAEAYAREKDYDHAIEFFIKKTGIYRAREDYVAVASFLNNIGYLYFRKGDLPSARDYFTQSIELCEKKKIDRGIFENSLNLARLYIAMAAEVGQSQGGFGELDEFANYVADKLNLTLQLTDEEEAYHGELRSRVYLLLAQMSFLDAELPPENDLERQIPVSLNQLEKLNTARIYIEEALRISGEQQLPLNQCQAQLAMGALYSFMNNRVAAYPHLARAREMAIDNGYLEYIWKSSTSLGNLLSLLSREEKVKLSIQKAPFEYYAEAVDVLEANVGSGIVASEGGQWHSFQAPYRQAFSYLAQKGDWYGALLIAEHMRSFFYIRLLNEENIVFADSAQQRLYQKATELQRQLSRNRIEMLKMRTRIDVSPSRRAQLRQQSEDLQTALQQAVAEMDKLNPQLKYLVRPAHVPLEDVRQRLEPGDAILNSLVHSGRLFAWIITSSDLRFESFDFDGAKVGLAAGKESDIQALARRYCLDKILSEMPDIKRLTVIPDFQDLGLPWFEMVNAAAPETRFLNVAVATSLSSFFSAAQKSTSDGQEMFLANDDELHRVLAGPAFFIATPMATGMENSFSGQISSLRIADFIHLNLTAKWNRNSPARSLLGFPIRNSTPAVFSPLDLYSLDIRPTAVSLEFERAWPAPAVSLTALVNAFNFAGAPAVIVGGGTPDAELENRFYSEFYRLAQSMSPGQAFTETKHNLLSRGIAAAKLSRFQLFGYNGEPGISRNRQEKKSAAVLVAESERLLNQAKIGAALKGFWQAAAMERSQGGKIAVLNSIKQTAVNWQQWSHAVRAQHALNRIYRGTRDHAALAEGYYALSFFYDRETKGDSAALNLRRAREHVTQYGLDNIEPQTWLHLAESVSRPASAELALKLIEKAKAGFGQEDGLNLALCRKAQGRIYLRLMQNFSLALPGLEQALEYFQKNGPIEQHVRTAILNAAALRQLGDGPGAVAILDQALGPARQMPDSPLKGRLYYAFSQSLHACGHYAAALEKLESAIRIYEKQRTSGGLVRCYHLRGTIRMALGNADSAAQDQLLALQLAKDSESERIVPAIYRAMATREWQNHNLDKALINFGNAIERDSLNRDYSGLVSGLTGQAALQLESGNSPAAMATLGRIPADSIYQATLWEKTQIDLLKAGALFGTQNRSEARAIASDCLHRSLTGFDFPGAASALYWLGYFHQDTNPDSALSYYQRAADLLLNESVNKSSLLFFRARELFDRMIDLAIRRSRFSQALVWAELSGFYHQRISPEKGLSSFAGLDSSSLRSLKEARQQFLIQRGILQYHMVRQKRHELLSSDYADKTRDAYSNLVLAREQLKKLNPSRARWFFFPDSLMKRISAALPENGGALVFHMDTDRLYSWIVTKENLHFNSTTVDRQKLDSLISAFNDSVRTGGNSVAGDMLYALLLKPLSPYLEATSQLYIVPYGALTGLFFQALPDQAGNFLGVGKSISKISGLYSLVFYHEGEQDDAPASISVFDLAPRPLDAKDRFLHDREITMLQRYFENVRIFREQRATTNQWKKASSQKITFFRGKFTSMAREPKSSFLAFRQDSAALDRLTARGLYGTSTQSKVVVLKFVAEPNGAEMEGPGFVALANGLAYSGVGSILAGSSSAHSFDSLLLFKRFIYNLAEGQSPGQAIHLARKYHFNTHNQSPGPWLCWELWGHF